MAHEIIRESEVREVLEGARVIAVLGAHPSQSRPAAYVPSSLKGVGYRVIPVNPRFAGQQILGEAVCSRLSEITEPVDIVDVFRRSEDVPAHVDDILAMQPLPKVVWLQMGISNDEAAARLIEAGIDVVQDRCTLADHRRFGLEARPST